MQLVGPQPILESPVQTGATAALPKAAVFASISVAVLIVLGGLGYLVYYLAFSSSSSSSPHPSSSSSSAGLTLGQNHASSSLVSSSVSSSPISSSASSSSSSSSSSLLVAQQACNGTVVCVSSYGASPSANATTNTLAIQLAITAALTHTTSTVLFDTAGATYNISVNTDVPTFWPATGQSIVIEGNGCLLFATDASPSGTIFGFVGAGAGAGNSISFQNFTVDALNPPWAQGYFLAQPTSTSWTFQASGTIPDPPTTLPGMGYVYQLNPSFSNIVNVFGFQGCSNYSFSINNSTSPSIYTFTSGSGCSSLPSSIPVGTPFVIGFSNSFGTIGTETTDNTYIRNVVLHQGQSGFAYTGNVTVDRLIADVGPGKWFVTGGGFLAGYHTYGSVSITNSVFRWGGDDITDYPMCIYVILSPVNSSTSPVVSASTANVTAWGQWDEGFPNPFFGLNRFGMVSPAGNYLLDGSGKPYEYYMQVFNQTATLGANQGLQFYSTSYYQFVITSSSAQALAALPVTSALNYYSLQAMQPTTLYVNNCSFGPSHSHAFYTNYVGGTLIQNSRFKNVVFGSIGSADIGNLEGSQMLNWVIDNNVFERDFDTLSVYGNMIAEVSIGAGQLYPNPDLSAPMGGGLNLTLSNNHFQYNGENTISSLTFNDAVVLSSLLNVNVFNNTISMNASAQYGYGIYILNSGNVNLCNNTVTGAPTGAIYVDAPSTVNVTNCSGAAWSQSTPSSSPAYAWNLPLHTNYQDASYSANLGTPAGSGVCAPTFGVYGGAQSVYLPCASSAVSVVYATVPVNYTVQVWMMLGNGATYGNNYFIDSAGSVTTWIAVLATGAGNPPDYGLIYPAFVTNNIGSVSGSPTGWHMYTFTYTNASSLYSVYFDGALIDSSSVPSSWSTSQRPNLILSSGLNPTYFANFTGLNYAQNASQITANYLSGG